MEDPGGEGVPATVRYPRGPLAVPLAPDDELPGGHVEVREVEPDDLGATESTPVEEPEERRVPRASRLARVAALEQRAEFPLRQSPALHHARSPDGLDRARAGHPVGVDQAEL